MSETFNGVYLSAAEPAIEGFLEKDSFEKSLMLNLLFQPFIMIPDNFFFSSSRLQAHILNSKKQTLLEASISQGLVVPVFRYKNKPSFIDSYQGISSSGIRGILNGSETVARRLQYAAESNKNFTPAFWPEYDLGEKFQQVIGKCLMCEIPPMTEPENIQKLKSLWDITKKWRFDTISQAIERTRKVTGTGLRKSEIIVALAQELGAKDISMIQQPIDLVKLPIHSKKKREALIFFCIWFSSLYAYNQAIEFGAIPNFSTYESLSGAVISNILPGNNPYLKGNEIERFVQDKSPIIQETVKLPPLEVLRRISINDLIAIRTEYGPDYFAALSAWQANPNNDNELNLRSSLDYYTKQILDTAHKSTNFIDAILESKIGISEPSKKLLADILDSVKEATSYFPLTGTIISIGKLGYAIYNWCRVQPEKQVIRLKGKNISRIELSLPQKQGW